MKSLPFKRALKVSIFPVNTDNHVAFGQTSWGLPSPRSVGALPGSPQEGAAPSLRSLQGLKKASCSRSGGRVGCSSKRASSRRTSGCTVVWPKRKAAVENTLDTVGSTVGS